jgi:hypothetical protein
MSDHSEWIPHDGGPCPVDPETVVDLRHADGNVITTEYSYADLVRQTEAQGVLPGVLDPFEDEADAECGLTCAP